MTITAETPTKTLRERAAELAHTHIGQRILPFGAGLDEDFYGLLMEALEQYGPPADGAEAFQRWIAMGTYQTVIANSLPVSDQERADMECWYREEKAL